MNALPSLSFQLGGGAPASAQDVSTIRGAFMQLFCYTYPMYTEDLCNTM